MQKTVFCLTLVCAWFCVSRGAFAQGGAIRTPDYPLVEQEIDSAQKGQDAANRLQQEDEEGKAGKNIYRGGSEEDPEANMRTLFEQILDPSSSEVDKWHSPHLRDSKYPRSAREAIATRRAEAGAGTIRRGWFGGRFCTRCTNGLGLFKTACRECQPQFGGCDFQDWYDPADVNRTCCLRNIVGTFPYKVRTTDSNFKTCCVREADKNATAETISCKYPKGDGWAGLFEYYYPTQVLGWENDRTTTMIASKAEVSRCVDQAAPLMQQKADWVEKAIKRNLEQVAKLDGGTTAQAGGDDQNQAADLPGKIQKDIREVSPKDQALRFADSLQGEGLTLRVNFPAMSSSFRRSLAQHFCMHPDQFMKIMDRDDDPTQKSYGSLKNDIPIWSNYCPQGVTLMTDPDQSLTLENIDDTPTKLNVGTRVWKDDPLYCQRQNAQKNSYLNEAIGGVLAKSGAGQAALSAEQTGFTCGENGKLNGGLVPVEMYRHAAVERRTAIADHALGFLIAGGLFPGEMRESGGIKSFYKRFEPQRYSEKFGIFSGKQFVGRSGGPTNEQFPPIVCDQVSGQSFAGDEANRSDRLYISDVTHKDVFTKAIINKPGNTEGSKEFDNYVQEWAEKSQENKIAHRGLDKDSNNYAAVFRIFATCPKGYTRWRHPDRSTDGETIDKLCGEEFLGGKHPPIGK